MNILVILQAVFQYRYLFDTVISSFPYYTFCIPIYLSELAAWIYHHKLLPRDATQWGFCDDTNLWFTDSFSSLCNLGVTILVVYCFLWMIIGCYNRSRMKRRFRNFYLCRNLGNDTWGILCWHARPALVHDMVDAQKTYHSVI